MLKKIFVTFLILPIIGGAIYGYFYFKKVKTPLTPVLSAIPADAVLVSGATDFSGTWRAFSAKSVMWKSLLSVGTFRKIESKVAFFDSLFVAGRQELGISDEQPVYFSAHPDSISGLEFLVSFNMPLAADRARVLRFIKDALQKRYTHEEKLVGGVSVSSFKGSDGAGFSFYHTKGILALSWNSSLLNSSLQALQKGRNLMTDSTFRTIVSTAGAQAEANVFINFSNLSKVLPVFLDPQSLPFVNSLGSFARWISLDVETGSDYLLMNGFTLSSDSLKDFLGIMKGQAPQRADMLNVLPANTAFFTFMGMSEPQIYLEKLSALQQSKINSAQGPLPGMNAKTFFSSWTGNEAAMLITEPLAEETAPDQLGIFRCKDKEKFFSILNDIRQTVGMNTGIRQDSLDLKYRDYRIYRLEWQSLLHEAWGQLFGQQKVYWITEIDNYLVFAPRPEAIQSMINFYLSDRTLNKIKHYRNFAASLPEKSNFFVYTSPARITGLLPGILSGKYASEVAMHTPVIRQFHSMGMQFSSNGKLFYNTLCLKYNPVYSPEFNTLWEFALDADISGAPLTIFNPVDSVQEVIVQDQASHLYRIDARGKELWKIKLDGKILSGGLTQIGPFTGNRWSIMAQTESSLYRISADGKIMDGFPVSFKFKPTATGAISSVSGKGDAVFIIPFEDLKLRAFDLSGQQDKDFVTESLRDTVLTPVQSWVLNGRNAVCIVDKSGNIRLMDKKGNWIVKVKEPVPAIQGYHWFLEKRKDVAKCGIWTAGPDGELYRTGFNGKSERFDFLEEKTSGKIMFSVGQLNADSPPEIAIARGNRLSVFKKNGIIIFNKRYTADIAFAPNFFTLGDSSHALAVNVKAEKGLHVYDQSGRLNRATILDGESPSSLLFIEKGTFPFIISGKRKTLRAYALDQLKFENEISPKPES